MSLYFGGLSATLIYVAALVAIPGGTRIFHGPYGYYNGQYWTKTDSINYVRPAKYFLSHGVFLDELGGTLTPSHWGVCTPVEGGASPDQLAPKLTPTYHRAIGYPLLITLFMKLFGSTWDMVLTAFNILAFALIYPYLFLISKLIFPGDWRTSFIVWPFFFLIASGTYFIQVPFYLADMTLTLLFVVGIYYGLKSQSSLRWIDLFGHIFFMSLATLVKPILVYFALIDGVMLACFAYYRNTYKQAKSRQFLLISVLVILAASQFNSYRNFVNHGRFMPSDVFSTNLFCFLGKDVADMSGESWLYTEGIRELYKIDRANVTLIDQKKIAKTKEIVSRHPVMAAYVILKRGMTVLFRSHFHLFGRTLIEEPHSVVVWMLLYPFTYLLYSLLYIGFLFFCMRLVRERKYLLLLPIISLVGYVLVPAFLGGAGSRLRLPIEGFIVMFAFAEVYCWAWGSGWTACAKSKFSKHCGAAGHYR